MFIFAFETQVKAVSFCNLIINLKSTCMNKRTFVSLMFCFVGAVASYGQNENENDYGVNEANTKFSFQNGILGGDTDYDYFSLKDHEDVSGVPLGGIGVGNINLAPSGQFTRIGINNIHTPIKRSESSFSLYGCEREMKRKQSVWSEILKTIRDGGSETHPIQRIVSNSSVKLCG